MKTGKIELLVLVDRSGSMISIKKDIEGSFKQYLEDQKKVPGECNMTLVKFDDAYEVVYENKPIAEITEFVIEPRGGTALLDSLGKIIDETGARLSKTPEDDRPERVIVLVMSDGETNSDTIFTGEQVKQKIELQENSYNWKFIFIGCNFDSITAAKNIGISTNSSLNFCSNAASITGAFAAVSGATTYYRTNVNQFGTLSAVDQYVFSQAERDAANQNP